MDEKYQADPVQAAYNAENAARRLAENADRICNRSEDDRERELNDYFYGNPDA